MVKFYVVLGEFSYVFAILQLSFYSFALIFSCVSMRLTKLAVKYRLSDVRRVFQKF